MLQNLEECWSLKNISVRPVSDFHWNEATTSVLFPLPCNDGSVLLVFAMNFGIREKLLGVESSNMHVIPTVEILLETPDKEH